MSQRGDRPTLRAALLDLVVPQECGGCGRNGTIWCTACAASVVGSVRKLDGAVAGAVAGAAAAEHAGPLGHAVVAYKDRGQRRLATPLAASLAAAVGTALSGIDPGAVPGRQGLAPVWLVPVPSRSEARRRRGVDHMAVLAARAARDLRRAGLPAHRCRLLEHVSAGRDQVGLGREARHANVVGALRAAVPPSGVLIVVDDVTTTGATLHEAVRALRVAMARAAQGAGAPTDWPILVATITVATRHGESASDAWEH